MRICLSRQGCKNNVSVARDFSIMKKQNKREHRTHHDTRAEGNALRHNSNATTQTDKYISLISGQKRKNENAAISNMQRGNNVVKLQVGSNLASQGLALGERDAAADRE